MKVVPLMLLFVYSTLVLDMILHHNLFMFLSCSCFHTYGNNVLFELMFCTSCVLFLVFMLHDLDFITRLAFVMVLFMVFGNQFVIMDIDARCGISIFKMASSSNEPTKEYVS